MHNYSFHPLADLFPLMEGTEFEALVADIKVNGLREPIKLLGGKILDGRNRYRACMAAGFKPYFTHLPAVDPVKYVISANILRRHLTSEQKRDLVEKLLKAKPGASNNAIAKQVKVDDKTVAKVRHELEARSEIPNVEVRTDTKGRKQPAKKSRKRGRTVKEVVEPEPVEQPENNNPTIFSIFSNPIARAWIKATNAQRKEFALEYKELIAGFVAEEQRRLPYAEQRRLHHPANDLDTKIDTKIETKTETEENATNGSAAGDGDGLDIPEWLRRTAP